jgi:acyl-CoA synthetase (AMP-forming)/AMP-acid ligase II
LDGELFVTGRTKDLIVLNGRSYHPVDIEQVCEAAVAGIRGNWRMRLGSETTSEAKSPSITASAEGAV